ncbi:hypothetical protein HELRODRAFT_191771 [Helobdella robusta]|uniref:E3 ubiquitin-protein ligase RNF10 n=1 Tax=Helobdella robusta TaxID=6412 RepID=T1FTA9_HELRO|nr:hypothetical protein HELRODRAFT_191771 [Helobdella robusta]ESO04424.1 hypothetical protein HELRODRAFT_191771 [Helobdella robusta]
MINFHYDDSHRSSRKQGYSGYHDNYRYGNSKKSGSNKSQCYKKKGFFNKERFLQANCQFVVKSDGDYGVHSVDPDALAQWELIQQVKLTVHEAPYCPICLYPPKAAKITRCGHIYCWPCILHYLSLDDKSWRKCPICSDAVHSNDLKSVQATLVTKYEAGMQITMKLMKKLRGQLTVVPKSQWIHNVGHLRSVRDLKQSLYAKLLTSDDDYISDMMMKERVELLEVLNEETENNLESCFIKLALEKLEKQRMDWIGSSSSPPCLLSPELPSDAKTVLKKLDTLIKKDGDDDIGAQVNSQSCASVKFYVSAFDDDEAVGGHELVGGNDAGEDDKEREDEEDDNDDDAGGGFVLSAAINEDYKHKKLIKNFDDLAEDCQNDDNDEIKNDVGCVAKKQDEKMLKVTDRVDNDEERNVLHFYQAADGQHIYMHALNVKSLKQDFLTLSRCPDEIVANILEVEERSMDELWRDRLRYLNHLPLSCEFKLVELDLRPPIISKDAYDVFEEVRKSREAERKRKMKRDCKMAARIQREENRKLGIDPTAQIVRSDYRKDVRTMKISETSSSSSGNDHHDNEFNADAEFCGPAKVADEVMRQNNSPMSFAQMIRMGKTKQQQPFGTAKASMQENSDKHGKTNVKNKDADDDECGGVSLVPDFKVTWCEGIEEKLRNMEMSGKQSDHHHYDHDRCSNGEDGGMKKNKKKKNKQTLLFTTRGVGPRC